MLFFSPFSLNFQLPKSFKLGEFGEVQLSLAGSVFRSIFQCNEVLLPPSFLICAPLPMHHLPRPIWVVLCLSSDDKVRI